MRRLLLALAVACLSLTAPSAVWADSDQQRALGAVNAGNAKPLNEILDALRGRYAGEILDAELFERNGKSFYRIKLLDPDGRVRELTVNARTGDVVGER